MVRSDLGDISPNIKGLTDGHTRFHGERQACVTHRTRRKTLGKHIPVSSSFDGLGEGLETALDGPGNILCRMSISGCSTSTKRSQSIRRWPYSIGPGPHHSRRAKKGKQESFGNFADDVIVSWKERWAAGGATRQHNTACSADMNMSTLHPRVFRLFSAFTSSEVPLRGLLCITRSSFPAHDLFSASFNTLCARLSASPSPSPSLLLDVSLNLNQRCVATTPSRERG